MWMTLATYICVIVMKWLSSESKYVKNLNIGKSMLLLACVSPVCIFCFDLFTYAKKWIFPLHKSSGSANRHLDPDTPNTRLITSWRSYADRQLNMSGPVPDINRLYDCAQTLSSLKADKITEVWNEIESCRNWKKLLCQHKIQLCRVKVLAKRTKYFPSVSCTMYMFCVFDNSLVK